MQSMKGDTQIRNPLSRPFHFEAQDDEIANYIMTPSLIGKTIRNVENDNGTAIPTERDKDGPSISFSQTAKDRLASHLDVRFQSFDHFNNKSLHDSFSSHKSENYLSKHILVSIKHIKSPHIENKLEEKQKPN